MRADGPEQNPAQAEYDVVVFWRKKPYDRGEVLAAADRARARGRYRQAIKSYRKILQVNPTDPVVHDRLAPILARSRDQRGEALESFRAAAQGHMKAGFFDRANAVHWQAVSFFPDEAELWEEIARIEQLMGRRADAVLALVKGSEQLGKRPKLRPNAIRLLEEALLIEPWHVDATLGLARLLAREGDRNAGVARLEDLAARVRGPALRRVRWALVRLAPTAGNVWGWIRSAFGRR